jgi:hypothetical protein
VTDAVRALSAEASDRALAEFRAAGGMLAQVGQALSPAN